MFQAFLLWGRLLKTVINIPISKADPDQMIVFGFANVSVTKDGHLITDLHGDQIPPDVLEKAAYKFVLKYREGGLEHEEMGVARLVESVFITPEKLKAMKINDPEYNGASWFVGFKVDDPEVWKMVKSGDLPAFSIGGEATFIEDEE